jgi:hypothetical protein
MGAAASKESDESGSRQAPRFAFWYLNSNERRGFGPLAFQTSRGPGPYEAGQATRAPRPRVERVRVPVVRTIGPCGESACVVMAAMATVALAMLCRSMATGPCAVAACGRPRGSDCGHKYQRQQQSQDTAVELCHRNAPRPLQWLSGLGCQTVACQPESQSNIPATNSEGTIG